MVEPWIAPLESGDPEAAWDLFIERYCRLIFGAIRHYTDRVEVVDFPLPFAMAVAGLLHATEGEVGLRANRRRVHVCDAGLEVGYGPERGVGVRCADPSTVSHFSGCAPNVPLDLHHRAFPPT